MIEINNKCNTSVGPRIVHSSYLSCTIWGNASIHLSYSVMMSFPGSRRPFPTWLHLTILSARLKEGLATTILVHYLVSYTYVIYAFTCSNKTLLANFFIKPFIVVNNLHEIHLLHFGWGEGSERMIKRI